MENAEREQLESKLRHIKDMLSRMRQNYVRATQLNNEYNQVMASYQGYEQDVPILDSELEKSKMNVKVPIILTTIYTIIRTLIMGGYTRYLYNTRYFSRKTGELHEEPEVKMTYLQGCISALPQSLLKALIVVAILLVISYLFNLLMNWGGREIVKDKQQKNAEIHKKNEAVTVHNRRCDARIQNIYQEAVAIKKSVSDLQAEYRKYIKGWYPEDMAFEEAVSSFLSDIHNYRADSMKEAQALFIQKKQHEILNNNMRQGFAVISSKIDNLAEIERYNGQLLRMNLNNQEILIKQSDAINRNMMMGFASVNLTNIMNTASINQNINSAANSINSNIAAGAQSVNRKLDNM